MLSNHLNTIIAFQGCVFDFPSDLDSYIEDHWQDGKFDSLQKATELPELLESEGFSSPRGGRGGRGGGFRGRGGGFRGRGGRGGGFRGGRGGSRGGFRGGRGGITIGGGDRQNKKITFD